jgi:endoglucanase
MAPPTRARWGIVALTACALTLSVGAPAFAANDVLDPTTTFFVDAQSTTKQAALNLKGEAKQDALLLSRYPSATWYTSGTPTEVQAAVNKLVKRTGEKVPVLVAYNLPYRDCSQYSAGGAASVADYKAWIDGFAAGIGDEEVVVILEPDGLGIIPNYIDINGNAEWCQPTGPEATPADRYEMLNYAVDAFAALPNTAVYLDGTSSAWLSVGDTADRLVKAGVADSDGFFLNASNYQYTENLVQYGTWVSACIESGSYSGCPNQYWNGGPDGTMIADLLGAWQGVALSSYGIWSDTATDPALNTSGINARYAGMAAGTTHFVIDTSRNGQGPWDPSTYPYDPATAEDWCNPPNRGLGVAPTTVTGNDLVDAYLWIKVPGESDGQCYRGTGGPLDPVRGTLDPAAGQWFVAQAHELIQFANPAVP